MKVNLHQMRMQRNLSQLHLAKLAHTSRSYISEIESGKYKNFGVVLLCKLCKALKCTPNDLIECEDDEDDKC